MAQLHGKAYRGGGSAGRDVKRKRPAKTSEREDLIAKYKFEKEDLVEMLRNIVLSRKLDDAEISMKKQSKAFFQISGAGHEGILTAAAKVMRPGHDWFVAYYRDRALCLGLGVTPYEMLCQANGNLGDTSGQGRQMPAHWGNKELNIFNKSSCTGTQFLHACGLAEAGKFLHDLNEDGVDAGTRPFKADEVVYCSTGDGTISQGEFWEGLTTAAVNKLPVIFVVEDNGYAISTPKEVQTPEGSISKTLKNFPGLLILETDGNCPIQSYDAMFRAHRHARTGKGPVLVHAHTTRPYSHSMSDDQSMYRTKKELELEKQEDVINAYPRFLKEAKLLTAKEIDSVFEDVSQEVKRETKRALETSWPAKESYAQHLYSHEVDIGGEEFVSEPSFSGKDDVPMAAAINGVLKSEFAKNPLLRMWGQDVADFGQSELEKLKDKSLKGKGGVFKISAGVQRGSRTGQVLDSPLAEANIIGRAVAQAARGIKPVVEIQFFDYIWTAYMQLKNEMAVLRYRSAGDFSCPMVVRVPIGGYLRGGAIYHSQCGESLFTHIPGIRVAYPSCALDAAGLLRTAIRADDPVMFLEHKHLYYQGYNRTADPGADYTIPFGRAALVREGRDCTIVTWGALVQKSLEASRMMEEKGVSVEILDLRTLAPFDKEAIFASLRKTNRILICHEEVITSGFAGEIAACINEECFEALDAPIMRVAAKDCHVAYNPDLEEEILPQVGDIEEALNRLMAY